MRGFPATIGLSFGSAIDSTVAEAPSGTQDIQGLQTFDEIMVQNADVNLETFGVDGIYRPSVLNRAIRGHVIYPTDDDQVAPVSRHRGPTVHIKVKNNATIGITPEEFETGHIINIPPRKGADPRDFQMARIVRQNAGFVVYEVH